MELSYDEALARLNVIYARQNYVGTVRIHIYADGEEQRERTSLQHKLARRRNNVNEMTRFSPPRTRFDWGDSARSDGVVDGTVFHTTGRQNEQHQQQQRDYGQIETRFQQQLLRHRFSVRTSDKTAGNEATMELAPKVWNIGTQERPLRNQRNVVAASSALHPETTVAEHDRPWNSSVNVPHDAFGSLSSSPPRALEEMQPLLASPQRHRQQKEEQHNMHVSHRAVETGARAIPVFDYTATGTSDAQQCQSASISPPRPLPSVPGLGEAEASASSATRRPQAEAMAFSPPRHHNARRSAQQPLPQRATTPPAATSSNRIVGSNSSGVSNVRRTHRYDHVKPTISRLRHPQDPQFSPRRNNGSRNSTTQALAGFFASTVPTSSAELDHRGKNGVAWVVK